MQIGAVSKSKEVAAYVAPCWNSCGFMCSVDVAPITLIILRSDRLCRTFWLAVVLTLLNLTAKLLMLCIPRRDLYRSLDGQSGFWWYPRSKQAWNIYTWWENPLSWGGAGLDELSWLFSLRLRFCWVGVFFLKVWITVTIFSGGCWVFRKLFVKFMGTFSLGI